MLRFRSPRRILIGSLLLLLIGCCSIGAIGWFAPPQVAARVCDSYALDAFYDAYPAYGGYKFEHLEGTATVIAPATYQIDAQVAIITGGFKGMLDNYPERRYTATYSCLVRRQGLGVLEAQWQGQITHISPLSPQQSP